MADPAHPYLGRPETASHLGFGVVRPFRRDARADFATASGEALVRSCVAQVLGTLCASDSGTTQGELPWRSDFGCLLPLLRHRGLTDATKQLARVYVANALAKWEPRARVRSVSVDSVERDGGLALVVSLRYDVVAGATSNQVFVPDVSQVVYIPAA